MGFIGYRKLDDRVRIFLECTEASCTYPVDVVFIKPDDVRLSGVSDVLALKKFYKLVNALEERAREQGRERQVIFHSPADLLEHLRLTRNAREFSEDPPSRLPEAPQTTVE